MSLSVHSIADAAVTILTDYGMGDLSMRRLARELGVGPSALYWHVGSKQEIFVLVARRIAQEVDDALADVAALSGLAVLLQLRTDLLRYRDGADIFALAYAHSGEAVLPQALRTSIADASLRHCGTVLVCGAVSFEQNRALFGTSAGPEDPHAALTGTLERIGICSG